MKKLQVLYITAFFAACLVPSLGMAVTKQEASSENRRLAEFPELKKENGINTQWLPEAGEYFQEHFAFRNELVTANALLVVCVGFVFFRADTMKQGCFWIREMFTDFGWKASAMSLTLQQLTPVYLVTLAAALVAAVPVNSMLKKYKWYEGFTYVLSLAGFGLCVLSLAGGTYNPFIYFRF